MIRYKSNRRDTNCMEDEFKPSNSMLMNVWSKKPLVCQLTNYVTVNDCANITICAGGSPVMTDATEDIEDMVAISSALVLNIGTLNSRTVESMMLAGRTANKLGVPIIFDPVGAGATRYRTFTAKNIIDKLDIAVIKGNSGEIATLCGMDGKVRGVDSDSVFGADAALNLALKTGSIVAMTGKVDYVSDGKDTYKLENGTANLDCISGSGCMLSAVTGCYVGANGVSIDSVISAISAFNIAGELVTGSEGPGTFKARLFDSLYNLSAADVATRTRKTKL